VLLALLLFADAIYFVVKSVEPTGMFAAILAVRLIFIYVFIRGARALIVYHTHIINK
jgi:hypothetical protein